jgi:hypothetical protein
MTYSLHHCLLKLCGYAKLPIVCGHFTKSGAMKNAQKDNFYRQLSCQWYDC